MRTTVKLDDDLLREVKKAAVDSGQTMAEVIENAVQDAMARRKSVGSRNRIKLTTVGGNGVRPGVDIYDSASLYELMDRLDDSARR